LGSKQPPKVTYGDSGNSSSSEEGNGNRKLHDCGEDMMMTIGGKKE